jgi:hypothetical protein
MRVLFLAVASLAAVGPPAASGELASLAAFPGVAELVVASAHPDLSEARLRRLVEVRLKRVGFLLPDGVAGAGRLSLKVSGDHSSSGSGSVSHTSYDVALTVAEPASLERDPSIRVSAVVWQRSKRVSVFSKELGPEAVIDLVQDLLSAFAADVGAARNDR